jgi:histidine triad (HIT) family protein
MDCIFCKIIEKKLPAKIVYEDESILAFHDIYPKAPTHILIVPKKHIHSLNHTNLEDQALLGKILLTAPKITSQLGHGDDGYRLIINTGESGGQTVFHIHIHLLTGKILNW